MSDLRKLCLALALNLKTGLDYFMGLSIFEFIDLCEDLQEVSKQQ